MYAICFYPELVLARGSPTAPGSILNEIGAVLGYGLLFFVLAIPVGMLFIYMMDNVTGTDNPYPALIITGIITLIVVVVIF